MTEVFFSDIVINRDTCFREVILQMGIPCLIIQDPPVPVKEDIVITFRCVQDRDNVSGSLFIIVWILFHCT